MIFEKTLLERPVDGARVRWCPSDLWLSSG